MADVARVTPELNVASRRSTKGRRFQRKSVLIEDRRRRAVQLRVAGMDIASIALKLAADPAINSDGVEFPAGYGLSNYKNGSPPPNQKALMRDVSADLALVARRNREMASEADQDLFDLEMMRLEMYTAFAMPKASAGSEKHIGRLIELSERRASMRGWNKTPVTVTHEGSIGITVEGPQPNFGDPKFVADIVRALTESSLEPPETVDAVAGLLPAVSESTLAEETIETTAEPVES